MLLTIHDQHLNKVAFIDNNKQKTLNYYGDNWRRQLETGSSTFEFTVFKRKVQSDTSSKQAYKSLNDKAFVSFKYKRKPYVFNVMKITEDEQTIKCYCENLNLELLNEYVNPYKATEALTFKQYCDNMGLLNFSLLSIGINEIADRKLTLEWTGQDTKLARLLSLANKFNAEIEFDTQLNPNSTLKSFKVNVYHENDEDHQGVGRVRTDIRLEYKKNLKSIKRTVDKTSIFNAVRPFGKNSEGNEVTIGGMIDPIKERNAKGILEFYQEGETLFAPISQQMYPSVFAPENSDDQWIRKDMTVESDNQSVIRAAGLKALKNAAYPAVSYEVDGFLDVEIGDTVQIYDSGFSPALNIRARVSEQTISFTNPKSNKTTFANFQELENRLSTNLQARLEQLIDEARAYTIRFTASNGTTFKNNTGTSVITPTLLKGAKEVSNVTWKWQLENAAITTGNTYTVNGSLITGAVTLTAMAFINNKEVARDSLSLVNVNDGARGEKGDRGDRGPQGPQGDQGIQGLQGPKGDQGIPGAKGADGRTQYTHIAFADNASGGGFSQTNQNKPYIGMYQDFNQTDSSNPSLYRWTKWKGSDGANGIPGKAGADGKTSYIHFAYADSADGRTGFTVNGKSSGDKKYMGTYTDFTEADSTDPTKYKWSLIKGADGVFDGVVGRRNLLKGTRALTRYAPASEFNGFKVARSVAGATGYRDTYSEQMTIAATGTEYIGLFWARASQNNYPIYCYFYNPGTTTTVTTSTGYTREQTGDGFCELRIGTEWKLYWVKWSQTSTNASKNVIFGRHGTWRGGAAGAWVEICAPALFEGHIVGDHVDAPEDTNDQIKQVEEQIPTNAAGRNYILNSDIGGSLSSNRTIDLSVSSDFFSDVNRDRSFTMSLEVEGKNIQAFNGRKRYGLAFRFSFTDGTDWYPEVWQEVDTDKKRITRVWTLPAGKDLKSVYYTKILNQTNSTVSCGKPKLELGKLMTAWLPAIEDAPKRFEQASVPTNPSKDSVWKYTGTTPTNVGGVTVLPNTAYRYDGSNWQKETVNSTNLTIQDQFVKKSMIADKAIDADKLNVRALSAISADLGEVRAGNVLLQKQFPAGMSRDYWGTYQYNPYTMGVYISQNMIASNGFPVRKKSTDKIGTDMPVAAFTSGGIYFIKTDRTDDLKTLAENAISSVNSGSIAFGYTPEGKNALITRVNGELYFHSDNYTDWAISQDNPNVKWKVQGNLVIVYYNVIFDSDGDKRIATIPPKYVPGKLMLDVKAWQIFKDYDRNCQLNEDGGLHILQAKAGIEYRGQVTWSY
jgi:phage minor structural protein